MTKPVMPTAMDNRDDVAAVRWEERSSSLGFDRMRAVERQGRKWAYYLGWNDCLKELQRRMDALEDEECTTR